jgi:hypothetical protein
MHAQAHQAFVVVSAGERKPFFMSDTDALELVKELLQSIDQVRGWVEATTGEVPEPGAYTIRQRERRAARVARGGKA